MSSKQSFEVSLIKQAHKPWMIHVTSSPHCHKSVKNIFYGCSFLFLTPAQWVSRGEKIILFNFLEYDKRVIAVDILLFFLNRTHISKRYLSKANITCSTVGSVVGEREKRKRQDMKDTKRWWRKFCLKLISSSEKSWEHKSLQRKSKRLVNGKAFFASALFAEALLGFEYI